MEKHKFTSIIRTVDGLLCVTFSNGAIFTVAECSDELYNKVIEARYDYDAVENLLAPNVKDIKEEVKEINELVEMVQYSSIVKKEGDSFYIKSISDVSVPTDLVESIIKAEQEGKEDELNSYLNFWRLCSMNPNSQARTNLFCFIKKWGMNITKSGLLIAYRNAIIKKEGEKINVELSKFISEKFLDIKHKKKKSPKKYVIALNQETDEHECLPEESPKLLETMSKKEEDDDDDRVKYDGDYENYDEDYDDYYEGEGDYDEDYNNEEDDDNSKTLKYIILGNLDELYKKCSSETDETVFTDKHSRSTDIRIGKVVKMKREDCDESQTSCSFGLHLGAKSWLEEGYYGDISFACFVNPAQIVAVPKEDNYGKLRCCEYYPVAIVQRENGKISDPFIENSVEDDFLNIVIQEYEINNKDVEKQVLNVPVIPEYSRKQIIDNLKAIKEQIKKKIVS